MTASETWRDHREWRIGSHYDIHIYAVNEIGDDEPLGTLLNPAIAAQVVSEHNLLLAGNTP